MPSNVLILPLLAGYLFIRIFYFTRYRAQSLEGYRLLLESATAGLFLALSGRIAVVVLKSLPIGVTLSEWWRQLTDVPYSGSAFFSVALAVILAPLLNLVQFENWRRAYRNASLGSLLRRRIVRFLALWRFATWKRQGRRLAPWNPSNLMEMRDRQQIKKRVALNWATRRQNNAVLRLLSEAAQFGSMVSVSLTTRKFYIGYVSSMPSLDPQETYFKLFPVRSGYRDSSTLTFQMTTDYNPVQESVESETPVFVILPLKDIVAVNTFDPQQYDKHFAGQGESGSPTPISSWTGEPRWRR